MQRRIIRRTRKTQPQEKSLLVAYLLMLVPPLGFFGVHKFYTGQILQGLAYMALTSSGVGSILVFFALVYDFFTMPMQMKGQAGLLGTSIPNRTNLVDYEEETISDTYGNMQTTRYEYSPMAEKAVVESFSSRSIEKEIIELAEKKELNQLTLKDVIKAGYTLDEAKAALDRFESEGLCEVVNMDGVKIYCFPS